MKEFFSKIKSHIILDRLIKLLISKEGDKINFHSN